LIPYIRYGLAKDVDGQLKQMVGDLKAIIDHLNAAGSTQQENNDPVSTRKRNYMYKEGLASTSPVNPWNIQKYFPLKSLLLTSPFPLGKFLHHSIRVCLVSVN
jgi:hypothetical protein